MAGGGRRRLQLLALAALLVLGLLAPLAAGIRRVPPAEETKRRLAEEEGGAQDKAGCLEAGFNPEQLKCGTCEKLAGVVLVDQDKEEEEKKKAGEALVAQCKRCCQEGGDAAKYARAVLECDEFFLSFLEPFKRFKASDEAMAWEKAGALAYKTTKGVRPTLLLFAAGEEKEPAESVSVAAWTTESIIEFLQESIPAPGAAAAAQGGGAKAAAAGSSASSHEEL